jgi:hypothetical protein
MKSFNRQSTSANQVELGRIRKWYSEEARSGSDLMDDIDEVIFSLESQADMAASNGNGVSFELTGGIDDTITYASGGDFLLTGQGFNDVTGGAGIDIVLDGETANDNAMIDRMAA